MAYGRGTCIVATSARPRRIMLGDVVLQLHPRHCSMKAVLNAKLAETVQVEVPAAQGTAA